MRITSFIISLPALVGVLFCATPSLLARAQTNLEKAVLKKAKIAMKLQGLERVYALAEILEKVALTKKASTKEKEELYHRLAAKLENKVAEVSGGHMSKVDLESLQAVEELIFQRKAEFAMNDPVIRGGSKHSGYTTTGTTNPKPRPKPKPSVATTPVVVEDDEWGTPDSTDDSWEPNEPREVAPSWMPSLGKKTKIAFSVVGGVVTLWVMAAVAIHNKRGRDDDEEEERQRGSFQT